MRGIDYLTLNEKINSIDEITNQLKETMHFVSDINKVVNAGMSDVQNR